MARSGVQYQDVQQAIDTLLSRGDTPSVQRIREVLGTGSFTTISEHFRQWRLEREHNRDVPPPKGLPEAVVSVASELWKEAREAAHDALCHYREEADRQVETAKLEANDADQRAANAEQRESALAEHLRHTETRVEGLSRDLAASQADEAQWRTQAREAREEVAKWQSAYERAQQQLGEHQAQHADQLSQQQAEWQARLTQEEQRHEAAEDRLMSLLDSARQERAQEESAYQQRLKQADKRNEKLAQEVKTLEKSIYQYQLEAHAEQQAQQQLQAALNALEQRYQEAIKKLDDAESALAEEARQHDAREKAWQEQLWSRMDAMQRQLTDLPTSLSRDQESEREDKDSLE
ncbi:DNA-binding protein [Halomonas sp. A40-4]|jgi:chromosome segregation ATPase|uniref:DNA-binding protein n=1 Tax=Halomonas sp. A40-4 TaxID=2785909 RepID=UPI0018F02013|nr:DNA-binding protein [Halomonas sp. A40-4]QPL47878.1 DNA-binding protein [Halomonas sp. A40-4]